MNVDERTALDDAVRLLKELIDPEPCLLDHHGNCQAHDLGNPCAHREAKEFLVELGEWPTG